MITGAFAAVLGANRMDFNARFAEARHRFPNIDKERFVAFLEHCVMPLVDAVDQVQAERSTAVAYAAYDVGLQLVGQQLVGGGNTQNHVMETGWRKLLPMIVHWVAQVPDRTLPAVSNALYHLSQSRDAQPLFWIETMARLGPQCTDLDHFLQIGQITAWRAGLAHMRPGALALAANVSPVLARAALGALATADWDGILTRLASDPWYNPTVSQPEDDRHLRLAARVGAFRGFGGLFLSPPLVAGDGQHFWIRSGDDCWLLMADGFGHTFHRASREEFDNAAKNKTLPKSIQIHGTTIKYKSPTSDEQIIELTGLGSIRSAAANSHTLALTSPQTHTVVLVALRS